MSKAFASQGDLSEKKTSFTEIGPGLYAFTACILASLVISHLTAKRA